MTVLTQLKVTIKISLQIIASMDISWKTIKSLAKRLTNQLASGRNYLTLQARIIKLTVLQISTVLESFQTFNSSVIRARAWAHNN